MSPFLLRLNDSLSEVLQTCDITSNFEKNFWQPCADGRFGDYQSNIAMILAKKERKNPQALATRICEIWNGKYAELATLTSKGPGFINLQFNPNFLIQIFQKY